MPSSASGVKMLSYDDILVYTVSHSVINEDSGVDVHQWGIRWELDEIAILLTAKC